MRLFYLFYDEISFYDNTYGICLSLFSKQTRTYLPTTSMVIYKISSVLNFLTNIQSSNQATNGTRHSTRLVTRAPVTGDSTRSDKVCIVRVLKIPGQDNNYVKSLVSIHSIFWHSTSFKKNSTLHYITSPQLYHSGGE